MPSPGPPVSGRGIYLLIPPVPAVLTLLLAALLADILAKLAAVLLPLGLAGLSQAVSQGRRLGTLTEY